MQAEALQPLDNLCDENNMSWALQLIFMGTLEQKISPLWALLTKSVGTFQEIPWAQFSEIWM